MKKIGFVIFVLFLLLMQPLAVNALTSSEAKLNWREAKELSIEAKQAHRDAKIEWAANKTDENNKKVIDTGKDSLNAALDEAETWLIYANLDAQENPGIPDELKQTIEADVNSNLLKIDSLRVEVNNVQTRVDLGVVFLKMVGKYVELVSDVGRNTGMGWVHVANTRADTVEDYESKLRAEAEGISDNDGIIDKLDLAASELETARNNIDNAEIAYESVRVPGQPLIKFSEGNNYLRVARANLLSAHKYLTQAFNLMAMEG